MSHDLVQIAITTVLLYTTALVLVRVIGRRTVLQLAGSILDTPPSNRSLWSPHPTGRFPS